MRSWMTLLACCIPLLGCDSAKKALTSSNAVALDPVAGTGVTVSNIKLTPATTTSGVTGTERKLLELSLDVHVTAAQPEDAHIAARLECEVNGKTIGADGKSFVHMNGKGVGSKLEEDVTVDVGRKIESEFEKCQVELAYLQRSSNQAALPSTTKSLGSVCYQDGKLTVGECPAGTLTRKAERDEPTVRDLAGVFDENPPPGQGGLTPPPGKPRPKYRFLFHYLLQHGKVPFPSDGHSLEGHCKTSAGVEKRFLGYPSQGNSVAPGVWQSMENGGWYFMEEPSACDMAFHLGGGSLTPGKGQKQGEIARFCLSKSGTTEGACKPPIVADGPASSASAAGSSAPSSAPE